MPGCQIIDIFVSCDKAKIVNGVFHFSLMPKTINKLKKLKPTLTLYSLSTKQAQKHVDQFGQHVYTKYSGTPI